MKLTIVSPVEIKHEHIIYGLRKSGNSCPIALAVQSGTDSICVGKTFINFIINKTLYTWQLDKTLQNFIKQFDGGEDKTKIKPTLGFIEIDYNELIL